MGSDQLRRGDGVVGVCLAVSGSVPLIMPDDEQCAAGSYPLGDTFIEGMLSNFRVRIKSSHKVELLLGGPNSQVGLNPSHLAGPALALLQCGGARGGVRRYVDGRDFPSVGGEP